jgi:hypothetical protein
LFADRTIPAPERSVEPWRQILDLSEDPRRANTYILLRDAWWPHPTHGPIRIDRDENLISFTCTCGETFGVPRFIAGEFGVD